MKTFDQLTVTQQQSAFEFAKERLKELLAMKILTSEKALSELEIELLVVAAAEGGTYDDNGKPVVEPIDIPYHFLGGCV